MKNCKAFTLIELLIVIVIIMLLTAIVVDSTLFKKRVGDQETRYKANESATMSQNTNSINIGDMVYIDGMNITGKVNQINESGMVNLLISDTNGTIRMQEGINSALLKKVVPSTNWKY
jgi:prepilin-type N-terminal cleavage/methylation domain-containing protein